MKRVVIGLIVGALWTCSGVAFSQVAKLQGLAGPEARGDSASFDPDRNQPETALPSCLVLSQEECNRSPHCFPLTGPSNCVDGICTADSVFMKCTLNTYYCRNDADCRHIRDYCNCLDVCLNKTVEAENCSQDSSSCQFTQDVPACECRDHICNTVFAEQ